MQGLCEAVEIALPGCGPDVAVLPRVQRGIVLGMLVGLFAFVAAIGPNGGGSFESAWIDWGFLWMGSFLAQSYLLGVWAALGKRPLTVRLPEAVGVASLAGLASAWGERRYSYPYAMSVHVSLLMVLLPMLLLWALLWIPRRRYGWRVGLCHEADVPTGARFQFSLRQLLAWMAGIALILALARWIAPGDMAFHGAFDWEEALEFSLMMLVPTALSFPTVLPCVGLIVGDDGRRTFAVWAALMAVLVAGLLWSVLFLVSYWFENPSGTSEMIALTKTCVIMTVSYQIGHLGVIGAGLIVFRLCGYRLTRGQRAPATADASEVSALATSDRPARGEAAEQADAGNRARRSPFPYLVAVLALVWLALCWPAWLVDAAKQEAAVERNLRDEWTQLGADNASIDGGQVALVNFPANQPVSEAALQKLKETGEAGQLEHLDLSGTLLTDDQLQYLGSLRCLRHLELRGTQITDAGLVHLQGLKGLESLTLSGTRVTDQGTKSLEQLENLESLSLDGTQVTDAGLSGLLPLKRLKSLTLSEPRVTSQAVAKFRQAAPACQVSLVPSIPNSQQGPIR